ncbi:hypothetical protein [Streptomyces sp. NPDC005890]|uniref:hypothetical protein n=1 Tax=Streptomyces sp. NPDC005890 TaxID=3154568 RepID=UPI0033CE5E34
MARIRTIKPEAFVSESLAAVSLTAERTFFGLLTQADDQGRHRDHAAIIAGQLWVLRPEHTPSAVEQDLAQLADSGLICRYKGPDDKRYLHIVTWRQHQKINRPSASRLPACPRHDTPARTASGVGTPAAGTGVTEPAPLSPGALREGSGQVRNPAVNPAPNGEPAGQDDLTEFSVREQGGLGEGAVTSHGPDLGPRIMDLGGFVWISGRTRGRCPRTGQVSGTDPVGGRDAGRNGRIDREIGMQVRLQEVGRLEGLMPPAVRTTGWSCRAGLAAASGRRWPGYPVSP